MVVYFDCAASSKPYYYKPQLWYNTNTLYGSDLRNNIEKQLLSELGLPLDWNIYVFSSCTEANEQVHLLANDNVWVDNTSHKSLRVCGHGTNLHIKGSSHLSFSKVCKLKGLLFVDLINSETGAIQDINFLLNIINLNVAVDITQALAVGYLPKELCQCKFITFTPSKIGVPKGIGFLISPIKHSFYEKTYPIELVEWTVNAIKKCKRHDFYAKQLSWNLLNYKNIKPLQHYCYQSYKGYNYICNWSKHIYPIYIDNVDVDILYTQLLKDGVIVGRGSACNLNYSETYKLLGFNPKNVLRLSINLDTTKKEFILGCETIKDYVEKLSKK